MTKYAVLNLSDAQKDELANETLKYSVESLLRLCWVKLLCFVKIWQSKVLLPR